MSGGLMSLIAYGVQDLMVSASRETMNRYYDNYYNERTDFAYLRYQEYKKYDMIFCNKLIYSLPILRELMPSMLFQSLVLEMMDLLEGEYWKRKGQGMILLELMVSISFPKQLTGLLLEEVDELYTKHCGGKFFEAHLREFPTRPYPRIAGEPNPDRGTCCGGGINAGVTGPIGSVGPSVEVIEEQKVQVLKKEKRLVDKKALKAMAKQQKINMKKGKRW